MLLRVLPSPPRMDLQSPIHVLSSPFRVPPSPLRVGHFSAVSRWPFSAAVVTWFGGRFDADDCQRRVPQAEGGAVSEHAHLIGVALRVVLRPQRDLWPTDARRSCQALPAFLIIVTLHKTGPWLVPAHGLLVFNIAIWSSATNIPNIRCALLATSPQPQLYINIIRIPIPAIQATPRNETSANRTPDGLRTRNLNDLLRVLNFHCNPNLIPEMHWYYVSPCMPRLY